MVKTHWKEFGGGALAKVLSDVGNTLTPLLTRHLIAYTMTKGGSVSRGVGFALGISFLLFISNFLLNIFFYNSTMTGAQVRSTLIAAIYKKNLRLSSKARLLFSNGKITNMMSTDTHRIDFACNWFHFSWVFPVSVGIAIALVVTNIGAPGMVGFGVFLVTFFLLILTGKHIAKLRKKATKVTDKRVSSMREILQAIKIIKFYSWEEAYLERIKNVRIRETRLVAKMLSWRNFINALIVSVPTLAGLLSFIVLSKTHGYLNPATVFSSLSVFNIMRMPVILLPISIITSIDAFQGLKRIERFLSAPEAESYLQIVDEGELQDDAIRISNGSFIWESLSNEEIQLLKEEEERAKKGRGGKKDKKSKKEKKQSEEDEEEEAEQTFLRIVHSRNAKNVPDIPSQNVAEECEPTSEAEMSTEILSSSEDKTDLHHTVFKGINNINLNVRRGEFVIITGAIGTGKSSLLAAMAGMMHKTSGSVEVSGSFVSAGQPWVQNATVRENILFGLPYDRKWYDTVVNACSLPRDFGILPAGDATEVGERGITLSGGQKARINLARAVYANRDIILLDDVLSAVDAHVGKFIMENCISGLLQHKTRVLATHQLALIENYADKVIFLDGSGSIEIGSVQELRSTVPAFNELMTYNDHDELASQEEMVDPMTLADSEENGTKLVRRITTHMSQVDEEKEAAEQQARIQAGALIVKESKAKDSIPFDVFKDFIRHGSFGLGWGIVVIFALAVILANFCQVFVNVWLSYWTSNKFPGKTSGFYIGLFVMFAILYGILSFAFFLLLTFVVNRTSRSLHIAAVKSILHAPMSFFDSSPIGRILNRFTHDTDAIDNEFSDQARLFLVSLASCISVFILIICFLPWMAIAFFGLGTIFVCISAYYRPSSREIKRLEAIARSRVYALFGEALSGTATIQSYNEAPRFTKDIEVQINRMNSATFLSLANQRWLASRLDVVGFCLCVIVTILCVTHQFQINPSSVGLVISSLLSVIPLMSMIVREMATTENNMNAVERLHEYAYKIPQEAAFHITETAPPKSWPEKGEIKFTNVSMAYRPDLPPALKNFTADVQPSEKIGICGRTGAGKSTIMIALYRLVEICGGKIEIDGVDISRIGLHELRSKIAIIPQDPVLFQGTIRSNIDPFGIYSDEELWDAMRRSWLIEPEEMEHMKELEARGINVSEVIRSREEMEGLPKFHLDRPVEDDGSNFSLGERQLLALATALVRRAPILVLDEATSNVDFATDQRIQSTIANEFKSCTILCIAHRLRTIINYDRILVMDHGNIAEFDSPRSLYVQENGIFRSMCDNSGITLESFDEGKGSSIKSYLSFNEKS